MTSREGEANCLIDFTPIAEELAQRLFDKTEYTYEKIIDNKVVTLIWPTWEFNIKLIREALEKAYEMKLGVR